MARNQNSRGYQHTDTANEPAELAAARSYTPPDVTLPSKFVGDPGPDRLRGLTGMTPKATGDSAMTSRAASNVKASPGITAELKTRLMTMNGEIANRIRSVVSRKPGR